MFMNADALLGGVPELIADTKSALAAVEERLEPLLDGSEKSTAEIMDAMMTLAN